MNRSAVLPAQKSTQFTSAPGAGSPSDGSKAFPTTILTSSLAQLALKALRGTPGAARDAAAELWEESGHDAALGKALLAFGGIEDDVLAAYETGEPDRLVRTPWGDVWLCAREPVERGVRDGAWATLRAMRALGRGYASLVLEDTCPEGTHEAGLRPADLAENDFS